MKQEPIVCVESHQPRYYELSYPDGGFGAMSSDDSLYSEGIYRQLFEIILHHPDWVFDSDSETINAKIREVVDETGTAGEVQLSHRKTNALLTVRFPNFRNGDIAEILLDFPLDTDIPSSEYGFVGEFRTLENAIVRRNMTSYLYPVTDSTVVAKIQVPGDFDPEVVENTLEAIGRIIDEKASIHSDLFAVLESYE